jgi:hypothetical protein
MSFELNDEGIVFQTVDEILEEMAASLRAKLAAAGVEGAANLDLSSTSPLGQVLAVMAEREEKRQLVTAAVYSSRFPSGAIGNALSQLSLVTGTVRRGATKSTADGVATLTAGTLLPAGSRANVDGGTSAIFETIEDVTNTSGITADFTVRMRAVELGPVLAASGALTVINTPVSGWEAITNPSDADPGLNIETDPELRLRREEELRAQGSTVISAIVADVAKVEGVRDAVGFENKTSSTVDGMSPHSFEIVVWDGTMPDAFDDAIAQAIFDSTPAGISAVASGGGTSESGTAIEPSTLDEFTIPFTRAGVQTLYLEFDVDVDADTYPVDGDDQIKDAVTAFVNDRLSIGDDVTASKLYVPILSAWVESDGTQHAAIAGVTDVTAIRLGFTVSPVGTSNLTVAARDIARADTARVVVNS